MRAYLLTFLALLVLTTLTLLLSFASLGPLAVPVALTIALAKAALIAVYFMHLDEQSSTHWVVLVVSCLIALTLLGLPALDVLTRGDPGPEQLGSPGLSVGGGGAAEP